MAFPYQSHWWPPCPGVFSYLPVPFQFKSELGRWEKVEGEWRGKRTEKAEKDVQGEELRVVLLEQYVCVKAARGKWKFPEKTGSFHAPSLQHCHIVTGAFLSSQVLCSIIQTAIEGQSDPPTQDRGRGHAQPSTLTTLRSQMLLALLLCSCWYSGGHRGL